jgi:hypothetical protein
MTMPTVLGLTTVLLLGGCQATNDADPLRIFSTSFDDVIALESLSSVRRVENLTIVPDPVDPANHALRIAVAEGDHYGASFHIPLAAHMGSEPTRISMRYRLWLDSSWAATSSGKLPGFSGTYARGGWGGRPSDGVNGWSARGMFGPLDASGRTPIGSYIYHADMVANGQQYGNSELWTIRLERERWYVIEQEIQLDTVDATGGRGDGWLRAWVDGQLVFDRRNLHVRDTEDLRIESVWVNVYYGGKTPAPSPMSLLIDDLWVGISRPDAASRHRAADR